MSSFPPRMSIVALFLLSAALPWQAAWAAPVPIPMQDGAEPDGMTDSADDAAPSDGATATDGAKPADAAKPEGTATPQTAQQVEQFLHYIMIARPDLAATAGEILVSDAITSAQLAQIVDGMNLGERLDRAIRRGRAMSGGVSELVGKFEVKLERGRLDLARENERMAEAIGMLDGTIRQQGLARARLVAAGEYAVPVLLTVIVDGRNPSVELAATDVIVSIGRLAVLPLVAALPDLDPSSQRKVAEMLAQIGWPTAVPFLQELTERGTAPNDVREVAFRGIARLGGARGAVANALASLAQDFFLRQLPLIPYPNEPVNNVWAWDSFGGLTPTPVPTPIFCDVMAMRLAERALRADPTNAQALAVFVASNLRRENDLPEGEADPVFGSLDHSPQFFATVVGTSVGQQVLALAIDTADTALVRDAIEALAQTGGAGVVTGTGGRTPIIECLGYPDRRVQFDAAIMLGQALPQERFPQDTAVVPLLASAARSAGIQYAAVVAPDSEDQRQIASSLSAKGFTVVGTAATWDDLVASALVGGMLDLVATRGRNDQLQATVSGVRRTNSTGAAPVLIVVAEEDRPAVERQFMLDHRIGIWTAGAPEETLDNTITDLIKRTSGGSINEGEAVSYAMRSLETLRDVALSRSPAFSINDAERTLAEALVSRSGSVRIAVADVFALIPTDTAQIKLIDVAMAASGDEQAELLLRVAASGRRNGNRAEPRQIASLRSLVKSSTGATADAAATAYGALGLPAEEAVQLLVK